MRLLIEVGAIAGALEQVPIVLDLLAGAGLGALVGNTIAYRRQQKDPELVASAFVVRWTWVGAALGALFSVMAEIS